MTALDVLRESNEAMAAGRYDGGFLSERWGLLPPEPPLDRAARQPPRVG
jgi:hypothetical protein